MRFALGIMEDRFEGALANCWAAGAAKGLGVVENDVMDAEPIERRFIAR
jgi:hypothetical protein